VKYFYCVEGDLLRLCDKQKGLYFIFEYTKNLQLLVQKCVDSNCIQLEDCISELRKYKFNYKEAEEAKEELNKLDNFRKFLQKYNIKIYFLDDNSVLDALVFPEMYYYKYMGLGDEKERLYYLSLLKIWTKRFLIAMEEFEKLKIIRFLSHLDSLDGRYAWWVKDKSEETATIVETEKGRAYLWFGYKDCEVLIKIEGGEEKCFS
jgi:hypothetical protein